MSEHTGIAWCDSTVNFWWGCQEVSPGCDHCYAKTLAAKLQGMIWGPLAPRKRIAGAIALAKRLNRKAIREGRRLRVFTNSMSDFFDNAVPDQWRHDAWAVIQECTNLDWLILTKRPQNIQRLGMSPLAGEMYRHVWLGVSAENQEEADRRIPVLMAMQASVRWVSFEPLLEAIVFRDSWAIDWAVVGGESGAARRDCGLDAIVATARAYRLRGIPLFMKQDSARLPDQQGRIPDEWFIRQWPQSPVESRGGVR